MRETFIILLTAALLVAQNPQSSPEAKAPPKFSVTTQLVTVGLTVKDKEGKPLQRLQIGDFTVSEDGKKQKLASADYQQLDNSLLAALPETKPDAAKKPAEPAPVAA